MKQKFITDDCMIKQKYPYIEIPNIFTPIPENREIYDTLFKEYLNIYKLTRKMYKRLNE